MRKHVAIGGAGIAVAAAVAAGGVSVAAGASDDDATDTPITGMALQDAERAALAETGAGTVTDTEVGDEQSRYEVEVTLDDGTQVDVQLDEHFRVVGTDDEGDGAADDDS